MAIINAKYDFKCTLFVVYSFKRVGFFSLFLEKIFSE